MKKMHVLFLAKKGRKTISFCRTIRNVWWASKLYYDGTIRSSIVLQISFSFGLIAQWIEHLPSKPVVVGSSPTQSVSISGLLQNEKCTVLVVACSKR